MKVRTIAAAAAVTTIVLAPGPVLANAADQADLSVVALSTTIAANEAEARRAPFRFSITNNGPDTADNVVVEIDFGKLDARKVGYEAPCATEGQKVVCRMESFPGGTGMEFTFPVYARVGQGAAGAVTVRARSATADPRPENNAVQVAAEVGAKRYELVAVAFEVYADDTEPPIEAWPVPAGGSATLDWFLVNTSDRPRKGLVYAIQLPERVSFAQRQDGCEYGADNRTMTCADPTAVLRPKLGNAYHVGGTRITVAADAQGPVLAGGTIQAYAREESSGGTANPNVKELSEGQRGRVAEVRLDEPVARYGVHVGPAQAEEGFLSTLSIGRLGSGASIALIGTVGAAVLATGVVLFIVSRRRRVVLVAPDDQAQSGT
jgi:hypothetical protein